MKIHHTWRFSSKGISSEANSKQQRDIRKMMGKWTHTDFLYMKRPLEGFQVASQHVLLLTLRCWNTWTWHVRTLPPCGSSLHKKNIIYYIILYYIYIYIYTHIIVCIYIYDIYVYSIHTYLYNLIYTYIYALFEDEAATHYASRQSSQHRGQWGWRACRVNFPHLDGLIEWSQATSVKKLRNLKHAGSKHINLKHIYIVGLQAFIHGPCGLSEHVVPSFFPVVDHHFLHQNWSYIAVYLIFRHSQIL